MIHFEKLEVNNVSVPRPNVIGSPKLNFSSPSDNYRNIHDSIDKQLNEIDIRHNSFWDTYARERWILIGSLTGVALIALVAKLISIFVNRKRKLSNAAFDIEGQRVLYRNKPQQVSIELQPLTHAIESGGVGHGHGHPTTASVTLESEQKQGEHVYTEVDDGSSSKLSFSYPKEKSQFYSK
jgi:hypothetical protein